jgi:uncharacterized protein YgbK (DUF1537 family)
MHGRGLLAAIIADDLTGAMDGAAPFARRGLRVKVIARSDDLDFTLADSPQVLSINCDTRHLAKDIAASVVSKVTTALVSLEPDLLIKKIDSTLRGNVVSETVAALGATDRETLIVCPALPTQGRTLLRGELFINSVPLRDTPIGRDLRSPPPTAPLHELFRTACCGLPVSVGKDCWESKTEELTEKKGIYIPDSENEEQLLSIAKSAQENRKNILFAGASGLTEALAETCYGPVCISDTPTIIKGISLFIVGSLASQSGAQIMALTKKNPGAILFEISDDSSYNRSFLKELAHSEELYSSLIIKPPAASEKSSLNSDRIARSLADCASVFLKHSRISMLLATGGDTAAALLDKLQAKVITVSGEVQPGVVHGFIDTPRGPVRLVTKAGGFGDEQLFNILIDFFN